jgi:hypothetical protein
MSRIERARARALQPELLLVTGLTLVGLAIRVAQFGQSIWADELSTVWILDGNGLGDVLSSVYSTDEITPPLYFVLAWAAVQVGPDPEWARLPSLLAGSATIPLVYLLGLRTVGSRAGLVGAAVLALSPFMIHYSVEARAYALMIALVTASTLFLLSALEDRRARWWVLYALCSCGALLSHYTAVFPLAAQFAWALWAHREAARPLLLANLGVLVGFAPWIPGFIADNDSPTTQILSALQPFTFEAVRFAVEQWAVGYPYVRLESVPGWTAGVLLAAGFGLALFAGALRAIGWQRRVRPSLPEAVRRVPPRVVLVVALALAAPVGEAIYSAVGTNVLGARNLNASWPGLALALGAAVTAAGPLVGAVSAALLLAGFAVGASLTLDPDRARIDYAAAANVIERRWSPGDVVVDAASLTPVPLTGLDNYLPQTNPEFRLGLPASDEPFMVADPVPPPDRLIADAIDAARGRAMFLVTHGDLSVPTGYVADLLRQRKRLGRLLLRRALPDFEVSYRRTLPGLAPLVVFEIEDRAESR